MPETTRQKITGALTPSFRTLACAAIAMGIAAPVHAESKAVLNRLVKKGLLTQQEADEIIAEESAEASQIQEKKIIANKAARAEAQGTLSPPPDKPAVGVKPAADATGQPKAQHWYDHIRIDGYVQMRLSQGLNDRADSLNVPADKSVSTTDYLMIRRARIKITGDVASNLHLYTQLDAQASLSSSTNLGVQARDVYFDLDLDDAAEHRIRAGLSKVPYGWVNMQSSQNRLPMERPDALNSGVEGERDYGIYYMWAGKEQRKIFKDLIKEGLKGSGDYGVAALGMYNGQGLNKPDLNHEPYALARFSYPWKDSSGQYYEAGIGGTYGNYVVSNGSIMRFNPNGTTAGAATPLGGNEFRDQRVFATFILYPQPFGFETEWTYGTGPELNGLQNRIENQSLFGGYVMVDYRMKFDGYEIIPFARWNYYDGARKFATNAPRDKVNEYDIGAEIEFGRSWELTVSYTYTDKRTKTDAVVNNRFIETTDAHRIAAQLQFNF